MMWGCPSTERRQEARLQKGLLQSPLPPLSLHSATLGLQSTWHQGPSLGKHGPNGALGGPWDFTHIGCASSTHFRRGCQRASCPQDPTVSTQSWRVSRHNATAPLACGPPLLRTGRPPADQSGHGLIYPAFHDRRGKAAKAAVAESEGQRWSSGTRIRCPPTGAATDTFRVPHPQARSTQGHC